MKVKRKPVFCYSELSGRIYIGFQRSIRKDGTIMLNPRYDITDQVFAHRSTINRLWRKRNKK
jgi:hypothetical protein